MPAGWSGPHLPLPFASPTLRPISNCNRPERAGSRPKILRAWRQHICSNRILHHEMERRSPTRHLIRIQIHGKRRFGNRRSDSRVTVRWQYPRLGVPSRRAGRQGALPPERELSQLAAATCAENDSRNSPSRLLHSVVLRLGTSRAPLANYAALFPHLNCRRFGLSLARENSRGARHLVRQRLAGSRADQ